MINLFALKVILIVVAALFIAAVVLLAIGLCKAKANADRDAELARRLEMERRG